MEKRNPQRGRAIIAPPNGTIAMMMFGCLDIQNRGLPHQTLRFGDGGVEMRT